MPIVIETLAGMILFLLGGAIGLALGDGRFSTPLLIVIVAGVILTIIAVVAVFLAACLIWLGGVA